MHFEDLQLMLIHLTCTLAILGVIGGTSTFYYTMIEEYYTGGLFLGPFNGVSDGSVILYTFFIIGAFLGNETFN